jgi:alkylhydroperoxidase family enzyme
MSWIEHLREDQDASGILERVYAGCRSRAGEVAEIIQVMSPRPDLLEPFLELYLRVMRGPSELSRAEREWVAVLTSDFNDCHY